MRSPDDVDGHEVSPSASSLGRRMSQMRASTGPKSHLPRTAGRALAPLGAGHRAPPVDGDALADADRLGVEQQQALLALLGLGQVLLRQRVAVLGHGGDDLVEVRDLPAPQVEDLLVAARRQRLEHGRRRPARAGTPCRRVFERDTSVRVRMSAGKSPRYMRLPARRSPSGSLTTSVPRQPQPPAEVDQRRARARLRPRGSGCSAGRRRRSCPACPPRRRPRRRRARARSRRGVA